MLQFAATPLAIGQVWNNGFKLARERLLPLYFLFLINQLIIHPLGYFVGGAHNTLADNFKHHPAIMIGYGIAFVIVTLIIYAIGFYLLGTLLKGRPYSFMESLEAALKKLPILIVASILSLLAAIVGFVIFIIPGIYIAVAMFYYFPAIIIDEMPIITAFKYTLSIVWGDWWRAFFVILAPMLVALFINAIVTLIVMVVSGLAQPQGPHIVARHITEIFNILFQAYMDLFILSVQLIQWNDLKIRKQLQQQSQPTTSATA